MAKRRTKLTAKEWTSAWAMARDVCVNDAYNTNQYGLTYKRAQAIRAAAELIWGAGSTGSLAAFNHALEGGKVCGLFLSEETITAVLGLAR